MAKLGLSTNQYGTEISVHECKGCGSRFTVCPPAGDNWGGCLAAGCESYDINRDVDALLFFGCRVTRRDNG